MKIIGLIATLFYVASATQPYVSYRSPFPSPGGVTYVNGVAPVGLVAQPLPYSASLHQSPAVGSYYQQGPIHYQQHPQVYQQQTQSYPLRIFQQVQQYPAYQQSSQLQAIPAYQHHIQPVQRVVNNSPVGRYEVRPEFSDKTEDITQPAVKTRKYEVRRPGIEKTFYDIEERVIVRPAGTALLEIVNPKDCDTPINTQKPPTVHPPQPAYPTEVPNYEPKYYPQQPSAHQPPVHQPQYPQNPTHQPGPTVVVVKHPVNPQPAYPKEVPNYEPKYYPQPPTVHPQHQPGPTVVIVKHPINPQPAYPKEVPNYEPKYYPQPPTVHQTPVHEHQYPQYPQPGPSIGVPTQKGADCVQEPQYPQYPHASSVLVQRTFYPQPAPNHQPKYYAQQPNQQHLTVGQSQQPQQQYIITPVPSTNQAHPVQQHFTINSTPASFIHQQPQQDNQKYTISSTPASFAHQQPQQQQQYAISSTPAPFVQQQPQQQQQFAISSTPAPFVQQQPQQQQQQFAISSTPAPFVQQQPQQQHQQQFVISSTPAPFAQLQPQQQHQQQFVISSTPAPFYHQQPQQQFVQQQPQQQFIISSTPGPFIHQQPQQQYGFGTNTGFINQQQPQHFAIGSNPATIQQQPSYNGDQSQQNFISSTPTPAYSTTSESFSNDNENEGDEDTVVINARIGKQPYKNIQNDSTINEQKTPSAEYNQKSEKLRNASRNENNYYDDQEDFSIDNAQQQNEDIGNQFMSARLQSADEPERGDQASNQNLQQNYEEQKPPQVQFNSNDASKNQQTLIQLLSAKNNGVTEVDGNNNYGDSGLVRARVISATPAPHNAEPTDERTNTRRVVVSRPVETVQEVSVVEPVSKFAKLTVQQRPAYRTPQVGLRRTQSNINVPLYVQPINQQQYGYTYDANY